LTPGYPPPQEEQLPELQLPQELPPLEAGMWSIKPKSALARDTNLEIARLEDVLHLGHSHSSSDLDSGRICSNLLLHLGQAYS
jgi:hypothetical protein